MEKNRVNKKFKIYIDGKFACYGKHLHWCDIIRGGFIDPFRNTVFLPYNEDYYSDFLVKHEYGHLLQIKKYGVFGYIFCIGIPSIISFTFDRKHHMTYPYEEDATSRGKARDYTVEVEFEY